MIVAGIDPGKTGAMVTLFEDGSTIIDRIPLRRGATPKSKLRPDYEEWSRNWRRSLDFNRPDMFFMELVEARPEQGTVSMFSFGKVMGFAMGLISAYDAPIHYERPAIWKAKMGLIGYDKSASIALARDLVPSIIPELDRKLKGNTSDVKHGIAEAALLAYYSVMTISAK